MDGVEPDDPFHWGVPHVVNHLCAENRPWATNRSLLEEAIRQGEFDGELLLTFEFLNSRKELMESLGVTQPGPKTKLIREIVSIQANSPAFKTWKRSLDVDESCFKLQLPLTHAYENTSVGTPPLPSMNEYQSGSSTALRHDLPHLHGRPITPGASSDCGVWRPGEMNKVRSGSEAPSPTRPPSLHALDPVSVTPQDFDDQIPQPKRRRLAPTNLSDKPINAAPVAIPTAADVITSETLAGRNTFPGEHTRPWDHAPLTAYYGLDGLSKFLICSSGDPVSSRFVKVGDDDFYVPYTTPLPPGQCIAVHNAIKKLLRSNSRKELLHSQGIIPSEASTDIVLDLDDLPDELDEETMAEIRTEEAENEELAKAKSRQFLKQEEVQKILDGAIHQMEERWNQVKRPKQAQKAYKLWMNANKQGLRKRRSLNAQLKVHYLEGRAQKLTLEILSGHWTKESEVLIQSGCLELTIEDKMLNSWLVQLYQSREKPPLPETLPRPPPKIPRRQFNVEEEEILTSSEEESDIEHFVISDVKEDKVMRDGGAETGGHNPEEAKSDEANVIKTELEACDLVDLTNLETPRTDIVDVNVTNSTTNKEPVADTEEKPATRAPGKIHDNLEIPESIDGTLDIQEVINHHWRYWAEKKDRLRLLVWLIWNTDPPFRQSVFDVLRENGANEAFEQTVEAHLSSPSVDKGKLSIEGTERTSAFQVTRIYLSFLKGKSIKSGRIAKVVKRDRNLLTGKPSRFATFRHLVNSIEEQFPKSSQIWNEEAVDQELEDEGMSHPDQDTPSKRRKKEIIQNKEALDFRVREQERIQGLERRRAQLSDRRNTAGGMASDVSRLIINDAREDKHDDVYVDPHIANDIKDHQIRGVKFMWNQVLADQGCLLAHTMGLGKTMQVITLLVALATTSQAEKSTMFDQIPKSLRKSKTLVLCTAGLVDNWEDEFLLWAPREVLGPLRKVDASLLDPERISVIQTWAEEGGILIVGYDMLKRMVQNKRMDVLLLHTPSIVIADEAHNMKNPAAQLTQVCAGFRTRCRIALTGSPLANNVEEYHAMIDWVAPNFLGPLSEFREIYAHPIQQGLYSDSTPWSKRKALKMLEVLKQTVAPKINRADMSCLRSDLPKKYEYVISLAATPTQRSLYDLYINGLRAELLGDSTPQSTKLPQARLFTVVSHLGLICNHPTIFRTKAIEVQKLVKSGKQLQFPPHLIEKTLQQTEGAIGEGLSGKVVCLLLILDEARKYKEKILVFSQSIITLDYLERLLSSQNRRVARLDGSTAVVKRQENTKNFNTNDMEIFLISTKAGGVGLNIQGANRVVIFDSKWNPVDDQQAIGRAWRIRQKLPVFVYRLSVAGTFEDDLQNKSVFKMQLASRVVDKKNPVSWAKRSSTLIHPILEVEQQDTTTFRGKDALLDQLIAFGQSSQLIRSIVETDVFEEEDLAEELTTEEKEETRKLIDIFSLRFTNKPEYERLMAIEQQILFQASSPRPTHAQSLEHGTATTGLDAHVLPGKPSNLHPAVAVALQYPRQQLAPSSSAFVNSNPRLQTSRTNLTNASVISGHTMKPVFPHLQQIAPPPTEGGWSNARPHPNQTTDGAADFPIILDSDSDTAMPVHRPSQPSKSFTPTPPIKRSPTTALFSGSGSAPIPMAGTNTTIGQTNVTRLPAPLHIVPSQMTASNGVGSSQAGQGTVFLAGGNQSKEDFRAKLRREASKILVIGYKGIKPPNSSSVSDHVVDGIDHHRANARQGFLPDTLHWKFLIEKLNEARFVRALIVQHWPFQFLALAPQEHINAQLEILKALSEDAFRAVMLDSRSSIDYLVSITRT